MWWYAPSWSADLVFSAAGIWSPNSCVKRDIRTSKITVLPPPPEVKQTALNGLIDSAIAMNIESHSSSSLLPLIFSFIRWHNYFFPPTWSDSGDSLYKWLLKSLAHFKVSVGMGIWEYWNTGELARAVLRNLNLLMWLGCSQNSVSIWLSSIFACWL